MAVGPVSPYGAGVTSDLDRRERIELCDRFLNLGPDAPTLCDGWTTADLAAHLVVRERDPRSAPGILLGGRFEPYTERLMARQLERYGYSGVVERVLSGPPMGPLRIPAARHAMNMVEFFVHHEDVRRANGEVPRLDRPDLDDALWSLVRRMFPLMVRRAKVPGTQLVIEAPDGRRAAAGSGAEVVMRGRVQELVLALYGRGDAAEVELAGEPAAVATVEAASFGI
ncbi:MAG: hypothetical protein JWM05_569 [Acidimicrobiales bacterium]|nr:hypothetical protein [Acidimicrobiales bacterium]